MRGPFQRNRFTAISAPPQLAFMPVISEANAADKNVPAEEDEDACEEWVAMDGGGFSLVRNAAAASPPSIMTPLPHTSKGRVRRLLALAALTLMLAAIVFGLLRGSAFWCGARGIPLGTVLQSPGFAMAEMPNLWGNVALVTGANTGLGLEVARQLARANATVVLACRDVVKCEEAAKSVRLDALAGVSVLQLDLSDLQNVADGVVRLRRQLRALHILVLNAGVAAQFPLALTVDGIERTFQANYLGHYVLATRLMPLLKATAKRARRPVRVVHLSSGAHRGAPPEGVPLSLEAINGPMGAYARYGMAKLASLAFSTELARRERGKVLSNAVHPGVVATELLRADNFASMLGPVAGRIAWLVAQARNFICAYSPETAALSVLYAAAAPEVFDRSITGELIVPIATRWPAHHPAATNASFGAALWEFSERVAREALRSSRGTGSTCRK